MVNTSLVERHGLRHKSQVLGKRPSEICPGEFGRIPAAQDAALLRTGRPLLDHLAEPVTPSALARRAQLAPPGLRA